MILGDFDAGLYGKLKALRGVVESHALTEIPGVHGAVSAPTASKLMIRDANGRVQVADPPAADDSQLVATTSWIRDNIQGLGGGTVTSITQGTGLSFSSNPITGTGTISLANTAVTPGTYQYPILSVDQQGRITSISHGYVVTSIGPQPPIYTHGGSTPDIYMYPATASMDGYATTTQIAKLNGIEANAQVNTVNTVFGRTGAVVATAGDYTVQKITGITVSTGSPSGGSDGDIWIKII